MKQPLKHSQKIRWTAGCLFFLCLLFTVSLALAEEVKLGEYRFPADTVELNLNGLALPVLDELIAGLQGFEKLETVHMIGCKLTRDHMRGLLAAFPHVTFEWIVKVQGKEISSLRTEYDFQKTRVKDVEGFIDALSCLPKLTKVDTYQTVFSRAVMAELWEKYPQIDFGWTLTIGKERVQTNVTAFSTLNHSSGPHYKTEHFECLKYCKGLLALDLGHNFIDDISFVINFPHLKILILADNHVSDLSPLAQLDELTYVELFLNDITDVSPLANKPALLDLNLCGNPLEGADITPLLTNSNLQRLWISNAKLSEEQQKTLAEGLPNCQISFTAGHATSEGWRDHERFDRYREGFVSQQYIPFDGTEKPKLVKK